ncbi:plasma membrane iron permease [Alternaria alternata]|nr:plasma membrane iron permease [Alternaria alternata]
MFGADLSDHQLMFSTGAGGGHKVSQSGAYVFSPHELGSGGGNNRFSKSGSLFKMPNVFAVPGASARTVIIDFVWYGVGAGILICLVICAGVIGTFYTAGRNTFDKAENIWEGAFAILASVIITLMGAALLRVSKLQDKWRVKISKVLEQKDSKLPIKGRLKRWTEKYAMFILPFVTVLREGIEAVLMLGSSLLEKVQQKQVQGRVATTSGRVFGTSTYVLVITGLLGLCADCYDSVVRHWRMVTAGWKEGKTAPSQHAQVESIASSEERETTGKKNSGEGIMTTTAVREVE